MTVPELPTEPSDAKKEFALARYNALLVEAKAAADAVLATEAASQAAEIAEAKAAADAIRTAATAQQAADIAEAKAAADGIRSAATAQQAADAALQKAELDSEYELLAAFHAELAEMTKGAIDRSQKTALFVETAASAIAAIYTGVLAFMVVVANATLPARGLIPGVFLGAAIALSVGYLAYLGKTSSISAPGPQPSRRAYQLARSAALVSFANESVLARAGFLRASVIALGLGALFLPVGLIDFTGAELFVWLAAGVLLVWTLAMPWIRKS